MMHRLCVVVLVSCLAVTAAADTQGVFAFGYNNNGQLGLSDTVVRKPQRVESLESLCIKQADVTESNAIYVTCDGEVYVSGAHTNANGQYSVSASDIAKSPVRVTSLAGHKAVMAGSGDAHFVLLTQQGRVFTWGFNHDGQLGYGNDVPFTAQPLEVASLATKNIRMIAAGGNRTGAISDVGELYLWGSGQSGEMGDGTTRSHRKPTLVQSFQTSNERVCQIAIGREHVAAVTNAGDLYTWGNGAGGQLGLGDFGMQRKKPMPVTRLRRNVCFAAAGEDFTAVVTQDDRVFLWGSNGYPSPFEKTFYQGLKPRQIGCGVSHLAVLLANGTLSTWGSKRYGQVGRDIASDFTLDPGLISLDTPVRQISVGKQQTLAFNGIYPAPSLCSCGSSWFSHWRTEEKFVSRCTDQQNTCGDGTCCGSEETCCPIANSATTPIQTLHSIDETIVHTPKFKCMPAKNAVCCEPSSEFACPASYNCHLETSPPRCEPVSARPGLTEEERAEQSEAPLRSKVTSSAPGFIPGSGVCGARKVTCADDTCCPAGQSCCPQADGSFGCCQHAQGVCCKSGCCSDGYTCDDDNFACVKKTPGSTALVRQSQDKVEGHCGASKRMCPDRSCCSNGYECCSLSDGFFGCCPFSNGVCCVDGSGCCPSGHSCDVPNSECVLHSSTDGEIRIPMKSTPRNTPQRSAASEVMCPNKMACGYPGTCCDNGAGGFGCCDFVNGTCCAGSIGCCPSDYECDVSGSSCKPFNPKGVTVPMKFVHDPKPPQHVALGEEICVGKTKCNDNTCCPQGSTCCTDANGQITCCDYMEAVCCADGGCCGADHVCDIENHVCRDKQGKQTYAHLSSQKTSAPEQSKKVDVSAPGKCYPDELMCNDGFCCPRSSTCCGKGFGQSGCCPHTHGVCCSNGGCCPGGSTCDVNSKSCTYPNDPEKQAAPMLLSDTPRAPEAEWDVEECLENEQTCAIDGGCCLKTESCCTVNAAEGGSMSACCPFEDGVCCNFGGCCPSETTCDEIHGACLSYTGEKVKDVAAVQGSVTHPIEGLAEIDCPDGSVCGPFDTCCSLGFDEEWGEEIYGCCEFENAVCCKEFEGCCPSGYECNAESKMCVTEGREIGGGNNSPTDPPPTFVCLHPLTQCANGRCCESNEYCAEQASGNFKCLPRGYATCNNGTHGCPVGLYCDQREDRIVCSAEEPNDPAVKEQLLRKYWGDDITATCNTLLQTSQDDAFTPQVKIERPPAQYWYPTRLAVRSKAVKATDTSLPTVLAAKICQHLNLANSNASTDFCYLSNANGHFLMKDRDRVKVLVDEYIRRVNIEQQGTAPSGPVYEFQAEELDPCPCRERPQPPQPQENTDLVAGSNDNEEAAILESVVSKEQSMSSAASTNYEVKEIPDERVVTNNAIKAGASTGAIPISQETPLEDVKFTLVLPTQDAMQTTQSVDSQNSGSDHDMIHAHRVETFMGKEACNEDGAENAVDLDGDEASAIDNNANNSANMQTTLAQMEANTAAAGNSMMPELL